MPETMTLPALDVAYDPHADVLTVDGVRYEAQVFRSVASVFVPRTVLAIDRDAEGNLSVSMVYEPPCGASVVHAGDGQGMRG